MPLDALITGRIATLADGAADGFGWVEAIGIRDGRVAFAGSEVDLETRADPHTERIVLEPDQVAIPGLTDAHLHLAVAGISDRDIDVHGTTSVEEGMALICCGRNVCLSGFATSGITSAVARILSAAAMYFSSKIGWKERTSPMLSKP